MIKAHGHAGGLLGNVDVGARSAYCDNQRMNMRQSLEIRAEEIMSTIECARDFACYRKKLRPLCTVKDIGMEGFVEIEKNGHHWCNFLVTFGKKYFCKCPLCVLLATDDITKT